MPDIYATVTEADPDLQERLADLLELRAADPAQRAMREVVLSDITFLRGARVLEVGCGTGAVTRVLAGSGATSLQRSRPRGVGGSKPDRFSATLPMPASSLENQRKGP